jgi:hypothetical protein
MQFPDIAATHHCTLCASFSSTTLTVVQEKRTIEGNPNVRSKDVLIHACVFGSIISDFNIFPHEAQLTRYEPDGYPLPSSLAQLDDSEVILPSSSSNIHPSIHASRVTLAATLAAPTILNLESAFAVTVN